MDKGEDHPLFLKRERCKQSFSRVNDIFTQIATRHGFKYSDRAGPNIGRGLYHDDTLDRGVFLELDKHWTKTDENNPEVVLANMVRYRPNPQGFPVHILTKTYYQGRLNDLDNAKLEELLDQACKDVLAVEQTDVLERGKRYDDFVEK